MIGFIAIWVITIPLIIKSRRKLKKIEDSIGKQAFLLDAKITYYDDNKQMSQGELISEISLNLKRIIENRELVTIERVTDSGDVVIKTSDGKKYDVQQQNIELL